MFLELQAYWFFSYHHIASPDFNPVEELFSYVKYYLKEHDLVLQSTPTLTPVLQAAFDSVTAQQCRGWIEHSGY